MASATRPHGAAPPPPCRRDVVSHHGSRSVHAATATVKSSSLGRLPRAQTGRHSRTPFTCTLSGAGGRAGTPPPATGSFTGRTTAVARRAAQAQSTCCCDSRPRESSPTTVQQVPGADCLQRPLLRRSRFRPRLTPSVDMTSDVKSWLKISLRHPAFPLLWCSGRDGASHIRRLILLISVDWVPPDLRPSGACLTLGTSMPVGLLTPTRVAPHRGGVSSDARWKLATLFVQWPSVLWTYGVTVTSLAMAHMKPTSSRAIATTTWFACFPRASSCR